MKALSSALVICLTVSASDAGLAQAPADSKAAGQEFKKVLSAIMAQAQSPAAKTKDNDQGDDRASDRAKIEVCTKDTPAARRSAICPVPVSP